MNFKTQYFSTELTLAQGYYWLIVDKNIKKMNFSKEEIFQKNQKVHRLNPNLMPLFPTSIPLLIFFCFTV